MHGYEYNLGYSKMKINKNFSALQCQEKIFLSIKTEKGENNVDKKMTLHVVEESFVFLSFGLFFWYDNGNPRTVVLLLLFLLLFSAADYILLTITSFRLVWYHSTVKIMCFTCHLDNTCAVFCIQV